MKQFPIFWFSICLGFEFSEYEPSALVQRQGGPCAVIAPVQAYLIKALCPEIGVSPLSDVGHTFNQFKMLFYRSIR